MQPYSLSHLANHVLLHDLAALVSQDRTTTAALLAHLAEVDERRLYLPAAYSCMHACCVGELRMSEDAAFKRIQAARTAREFPAIFAALAEGALNLTSVLLLRPHLTAETAKDLLAAAAYRTNKDLELLLAERFPRPDLATFVQAIEPADAGELPAARDEGVATAQLAARLVDSNTPRARVTPLSPQRFAVQFTSDEAGHRDLVEAQALLGRAVASGDVAEVFKCALREYVRHLKRQKCSATDRPRPCSRHRASDPRHVPAAVERAVWERDGNPCTFVSDQGHRCAERSGLQLDHVIPVARGGESTERNLQLRCAPHNQHAADLAYGKGFMDENRSEARRQAAEAKAQKAVADAARARERAAAAEELAAASDVIPGLKILGCCSDDLRYAARLCAAIPDGSTDVRMHHVIKALGRANMSRLTHVARSPN